MTVSIYEFSAPRLVRSLHALEHILDKAAAHAQAQGIDPGVLFAARLYPDMFPLVKQVQIATDNALRCVARLAGEEPPRIEDGEQDFAALKARIETAIAHIEAFAPERFEGAEKRTVTLQAGGQSHELAAPDYLMGFLLPNFYFHVTTAYDILRHNGVPLGKKDYLGAA